jgi:phosphate transport system substrate-binding protein
MSLDQHLYPMLLPVISEYAKEHHLKIHVEEGTCGISNGKLFSKEIDVGGYCCPPGRLDRLPGVTFHTLGISALALMVNPDNPVENITSSEVRKIYKGELVRWSSVQSLAGIKAADMPIQPVTRLHCKLRPGGWKLILPSEEQFTPSIHDVSSIPDMIAQVAADKRAIGYEVAWNALYHYKNKGDVKIIDIDGVSPMDHKALAQGRYPFYRTYNLTTWSGKGVTNREAEKLVAYLRKHVNEMDKQYGIVPWTDLKKAGWKFQEDELVGTP